MLAARQWVLILLLLSSLFGTTPVLAKPAEAEPVMQSNSLTLLAPSGCPSAGCPGGQRLSYRFAFTPTSYDAAANQTIKVCVYAPKVWHVNMTNKAGLTTSSTGLVTGKPYTSADAPSCATADPTIPSTHDVIIEADAILDPNTASDVLDFSFRMGTAAAGNGQVLVRLFEQDTTPKWNRTANVTSSILTAQPVAPEVYVANDPSTCGSASACYTNSVEDSSTSIGIGTGLKDAADAQPSKITVLGGYTIQSQAVHIANPLTLTGQNNATITFNGPTVCAPEAAILSLDDAPVTVQGLNINDGNCASPGRYLIEVNNPKTDAQVQIISNNLTHGNNAIEVKSSNVGPIVVQFNHITGNDGFALYAEANSQGPIAMIANNLNGNSLTNGAGMAVNCSGSPTGTDVIANRRADHNYWGSGLPGDTRATHCNISAGKMLGLPVLQNVGTPGVQAQRVPVTTTQTYAFDSQISYYRTGGSNFELYIVNHGYLTAGGPPFTNAKGLTSPLPCSNYFDVFLPENTNPDGTLELALKYNKTTACTAAVNSSAYCNQTSTPSKYPLYWYDPSPNGLTDNWDTTGSSPDNQDVDGQTTTCNMTNSEIRVSLDNSGRPNLANDLSYLPFMIGVPVLKSFVPLASTRKVTVSWATNNEPDLSGFIVLRGSTADNLTAITDEITHTGTALMGKSYSYTDSNIPNGTTYFYRLQIMRSDGSSFLSETRSITVADATITPTATARPTSTATLIQPTATRTFTLAPTRMPTRIPSITATFRPGQGTPSRTPTRGTPGVLNTLTLTAQALTPSGSGTPASSGTPANAQTLTAIAGGALETGTPEAEITLTPTSTPTLLVEAAQTTSRQHPWLSLLLGILAGMLTASAIGGTWWYLHGRHIL